MDSLFEETLIEKLDRQEAKLQQLLQCIPNNSNKQVILEKIDSLVKAAQNTGNSNCLTEKDLQQLILLLKQNIMRLQEPQRQKVQHHHYLHKGLITSIILFILVMVLAVLLTNRMSVQKAHEAADIKYRFLQLNPDKSLQKLLFKTDSLYIADPAATQLYVAQEEAKRKAQQELNRQAVMLEQQAKKLRERAK